jgi:hypothetical protein
MVTVIRYPALSLALAGLLTAQTPLENTGQPMRVAYECKAADTQAAGLGCSEDDPCPVYLELANVEAVGNKLLITGNLHTPMATLYSILLGSDDEGKTWSEPHMRLVTSGLDQIQFVDFQNGWISGANLQGAPRDPFFLITTDGGKTWRQQPIFEESRVAAIVSFRFATPVNGTVMIDARLDTGKIEEYRTLDGGQSWVAPIGSADGVFKSKPPVWRVRPDGSTHSYVIEKSESAHWRKIASFLVNITNCKE